MGRIRALIPFFLTLRGRLTTVIDFRRGECVIGAWRLGTDQERPVLPHHYLGYDSGEQPDVTGPVLLPPYFTKPVNRYVRVRCVRPTGPEGEDGADVCPTYADSGGLGILTLQPTSQAKTKAAGLTRHQLAMIVLGVPAISLGTLAIFWRKSLSEHPHFTTWHGVSQTVRTRSLLEIDVRHYAPHCPRSNVGPPSRPSGSSR